jgi:tetratricopeptide (TPR) repeat protein
MKISGRRFLNLFFVFCVIALAFCAQAQDSPETNSMTDAVAPAETISAADTMRAYLRLQEQIHETQLAIERSARDNELASIRNAAALSNRLQAVEQTVDMQRAHELEIVRAMMIIAGAFVVIGFFALLLTAYFHWRAVGKLAEIAAALPAARGLGEMPTVSALGLGENPLLLEQSNNRLLGALERLEKRISEIERGNSNGHLTDGSNGAKSLRAPETASDIAPRQKIISAPTDHSDEITSLLGKGHNFLDRDEIEQALACFDEALALNPQHVETLVKKGEALERLRRADDAIECYNRAIAADNTMTIAFLHKGGLLNRMERFDEAMECYEQALRTQEKRREN